MISATEMLEGSKVCYSGRLGLKSHSVICQKGLCSFSQKGLGNAMAGASTLTNKFLPPSAEKSNLYNVGLL